MTAEGIAGPWYLVDHPAGHRGAAGGREEATNRTNYTNGKRHIPVICAALSMLFAVRIAGHIPYVHCTLPLTG